MVGADVKWVSRISYIRYLILGVGVVDSLEVVLTLVDELVSWLGVLVCEALHNLITASHLLCWASR